MTPDRVHLDPDELLDDDTWLCAGCGRIYASLSAARACEESD